MAFPSGARCTRYTRARTATRRPRREGALSRTASRSAARRGARARVRREAWGGRRRAEGAEGERGEGGEGRRDDGDAPASAGGELVQPGRRLVEPPPAVEHRGGEASKIVVIGRKADAGGEIDPRRDRSDPYRGRAVRHAHPTRTR